MRTSIAAALVLLTSTSALAGSRGGDDPGRGGGRLGGVSSGIGGAVGGGGHGGGGGNGGGGSGDRPPDDGTRDPDYTSDVNHRGMYRRRHDGADIVYVDNEERVVRRKPPEPEINRMPAHLDLYLGIQKVVESETSFSATVAISDDWFRLAAYGTRYWEERMDGAGKLTMTMGGATFGFPIQQGGGSHAYLEGGVVLLKTANDPVSDSSISGGKVGLHLEQGLRSTTIVGDAHALLFEAGVKAFEARIALRYGKLEGAFRVLDFNVGPALYGPEIGLAF